jgi:ADA HAT complex component 1
MQSIFRLPWCTDPSADEKAMIPKMRQPPVVDMSLLSKLKRKRADSPTFEPLPAFDHAKRLKLSDADNNQPLPGRRQTDSQINMTIPEPKSHDSAANYGLQHSAANVPLLTPDVSFATTSPSAKPKQHLETGDKPEVLEGTKESQLQDVLEHQFNLEILLKHRELRLIEQELAKCQTALEQLRRCEVIPYPGSSGLSESLSSGTGPALKAQPGFTQPQAPSPWGVTDGPYTRHYARWLLNDPTFDSLPFSQVVSASDSYVLQPEGRSTRNSGAGIGKTGRSRSTRDSFGNLNSALPNYPAQSRGKQGPLVIRRLADNLFVKLICNNCQRGDFSSVQGFLNHCRIAHKVDYKSHEAAALDCGKPLEEDETHLIPQGAPAATSGAPKPQQAPKPSVSQAVPTPPAGFVHPLNAQILPRFTWKRQADEARASTTQSHSRRAVPSKPSESPAAASFHASPLVGSSLAPYLSARFAKRGLGGDLQHATTQAREKIDLGLDPAEDEQSTSTSSETPKSNGALSTNLNRSICKPSHEGSQGHKGWYAPISRPRPTPIMARHVPADMMDSPPSLSPHAVDSNPGLVSDHEDDDAPSDLDDVRSERHESPDAVSRLGVIRDRTCGDEIDVDLEVDVDDEANGHSVLIRPRSLGLQMRSSGSPSRAK